MNIKRTYDDDGLEQAYIVSMLVSVIITSWRKPTLFGPQTFKTSKPGENWLTPSPSGLSAKWIYPAQAYIYLLDTMCVKIRFFKVDLSRCLIDVSVETTKIKI